MSGRAASGTDAIEALFAEANRPGSPRRKRKRGRGWIAAAWIVGVLIVLLGAAWVIGNMWARSTAESVAATAVKQALPDDATSGKVRVSIGGTSVILQYLAGSFDTVDVDIHSLTVAGITAPAHITAHGVPTSLDGAIDELAIQLTLDAKTLGSVVTGQGTIASLGDGTIAVDKTVTASGAAVAVRATAKPTVTDGALTLTTTDAQVTKAPDGADPAALAALAKNQPPQTLCVADKLPKALPLSAISVTPEGATLTLAGSHVAISRAIITEKGAC